MIRNFTGDTGIFTSDGMTPMLYVEGLQRYIA